MARHIDDHTSYRFYRGDVMTAKQFYKEYGFGA